MRTQVIKFLASLILLLSVIWGSFYIFAAINLNENQWLCMPMIITASIAILSTIVYCIVQLIKIEWLRPNHDQAKTT